MKLHFRIHNDLFGRFCASEWVLQQVEEKHPERSLKSELWAIHPIFCWDEPIPRPPSQISSSPSTHRCCTSRLLGGDLELFFTCSFRAFFRCALPIGIVCKIFFLHFSLNLFRFLFVCLLISFAFRLILTNLMLIAFIVSGSLLCFCCQEEIFC